MDQFARIDLAQYLASAAPLFETSPDRGWLVYEIVEKPNGRLDKVPAPGFRTNDPTSWVTLGEAVAIAETYPVGAAGVGFIIVERLVTFDFDDCIGEDGEVVVEIAAMVERLDSFSYRTVSGTGMRVVCLNDEADPIPGCKRTRRTPGGQKVEIFIGPTNHFNTFSVETNGKPIAARGAVIRELLDELKARPPQREKAGSNNYGEFGRTSDLGKKAKNPKELISALKAIPPDFSTDRNEWVKLAGGFYAGMGGTERGRRVFLRWCEGWQRINDSSPEAAGKAEALWDSFDKSPPRAVGAGTVFALAKEHGWSRPKKETAADAPAPTIWLRTATVVPVQDFVENLLVINTLAMVFGAPNHGKSFLVMDLLAHVAWGRPWQGLAVKQGPTLLFAMEGDSGATNRMVAFRQHYQLTGEDVPFGLILGPIDLKSDAGADALIARIKAEERALGQPIAAVAIDTLARAIDNEDTSEVMNPVMTRCHRIRKATGCCLILIHHPGKDSRRGPRGFSGIVGALDTLIEVEHPNLDKAKPHRASVQKQRDLEVIDDLFFRLKPVELAGVESYHGKPVTSCVVMPITDAGERATAAAQVQAAKLTRAQKLALDALREALNEQGEDRPDGKPAARVTLLRSWRTVFCARQTATGTATRKTALRALARAKAALLSMGIIGLASDLVWLTTDD